MVTTIKMSHVSIAKSIVTRLLLRNSSRVAKLSAAYRNMRHFNNHSDARQAEDQQGIHDDNRDQICASPVRMTNFVVCSSPSSSSSSYSY
jgi:hypothetical protein